MEKLYFLRHFQTEVDPETPVSEWELSEKGRSEMEEFLASGVPEVDAVYTSPEPKALKLAERVIEQENLELIVCEELREVDRSRRGFIEDHSEYVETAREYLENDYPKTAWEPKSELKKRMKAFVELIEDSEFEEVLVVGHGLYFSVLLAEEPYWFWRELGFGEVVERDFGNLLDLKSWL